MGSAADKQLLKKAVQNFKAPIYFVVGFSAVLNAAYVVLLAYFVRYFHKVEHSDCKCAAGWRLPTLKVLMAVLIVLILVDVFLLTAISDNSTAMFLVSLLNAAVFSAIALIAYPYVRKMEKSKCQCAMTPTFGWLKVYSVVVLLAWILMVVLAVASLVLGKLLAMKVEKMKRGKK